MATIDPMAQLFDPQLMAQYRALLEPPQEAKRAAGMDALLALGLGLLANRSPHLGVAVGNAGVGAMGAYKSGMDSARDNRMGEIQGAIGLRKLQKEMEQEARRNELKAQVPQKEMLYFEMDPEGYVKAKMEALKPTDIERLGRVGGFTAEELSRAARVKGGLEPEPKAAGKSPLGELWAEFHSYPVGSPERASIMRRIQKEETHAPGASLSVGLQSPIIMQNADGSYSMMQPMTKPGYEAQVTQFPPGTKPAPPAGGDKFPAEIGRMTIAMDSLETGLTAYEAALKDFNPQNPADQANPQKRARIASLLADLRMQAKEAQALGALTGPDVEMLDKALTDPTSFKGMYYGTKGATSQIDESRKALQRRREALIKNYPSAGKAQGATGGAPQPQKSITVDW